MGDPVQPDGLATPEGDNEGSPNEPLSPVEMEDGDLERPRGDEPHSSEPLRPALSE